VWAGQSADPTTVSRVDSNTSLPVHIDENGVIIDVNMIVGIRYVWINMSGRGTKGQNII
jgi:hypothetical protein